MTVADSPAYAFGDFRLDAVKRQLLGPDGTPVTMTPKVFETLLYFVQRSERVLGKDELMAAIWPGRIVEENNLNQNISNLRRILGANSTDRRYIVTEPGRGYRFVAKVTALAEMHVEARPGDAAVTPADPAGSGHSLPGQIAATARRQKPGRAILGGAFALMAIVATGVWLARGAKFQAPSPSAITTLAVLPFKPLAEADRDEALEMGMTDTLIAKLSRSGRLVVRSLSSVRAFARIDQDPIEAGVQLGVGAVLDGEIQHHGEGLRVNARLLKVPGGEALWSTTFDRRLGDVFEMQDSIAEQATAALAIRLEGSERSAMNTHYTSNVDAYRLYLSGRYRAEKVKPEDLLAAIGFYRKAIGLDPAYAPAYAAMGDAYQRLPIAGDAAPNEAFPLAKASARKALDIDNQLAEAHAVLGWVALWYDWNWTDSEQEFRRAIELDPNLASARLGYAHLLSNLGRSEEAIEQGRKAVELDPLSPLSNTIVAGLAMNAGHADESRQLLDRALHLDPDFWIAHLALGMAALGRNKGDVALAELGKARDSSGGSLQVMPILAIALARAGREAEARTILEDLLERAQSGYVPPTSIAKIQIVLGDKEQALAWLERGYEARDVRMCFLKLDQSWDSLRADPRFIAIADRIDLH
jgi:DNA-binding winged helix-turn-helix (wHTH) protein/TolB-like protein/Tfp pilus assembly protein PilF